MSPWPVGYNSSEAALIAKREAQKEQKQKDEEAERRRKMYGFGIGVKGNVKNIIEKK